MLFAAIAAGGQSQDFSGQSALEMTRKVVAFGPRPPASAAIKRLEGFIRERLKVTRATVTEDAFTATTPLGPMPMRNLIARFAGSGGRAIVVSGHYDTKLMPGINFVGANDGGSSTGFLLELARVLHAREYWRELDDPKLLRRYERARAADVQAMAWVTDGLFSLFGAFSPGGNGLICPPPRVRKRWLVPTPSPMLRRLWAFRSRSDA